MTSVTGNSKSGTDIDSEIAYCPLTQPEEEATMNIELSGLGTKAVQEAEYEGESEVDEVVGKFIRMSKYYNIAFLIGVIISHEEIK